VRSGTGAAAERSGLCAAADECQSSAAHGKGNGNGNGLEKSSEYPRNGVCASVRVCEWVFGLICASGFP